MIMFF